jgi:hypothetical protein
VAGEGYPNIEDLIVAWLKTRLTVKQIHAGDIPDDVPPNLSAAVPVVMVGRFGGADTVQGFDNPRIDVDVFASGRTAALGIAERIRREMRITLPRLVLSGAVISRVATISPPISTAWDASTVRRVTSTYQLGVHHPI